ncbi:MAG: trypsin-like peptidase domain-containing protein [Bacteroidia bacterium]|nr:trypsin-like peptidase domain-containing protein [Bacteroidia bacterium]MCO5253301.1 trypsin-like peptidase domain-containing protein [Bacteroidota bacterium]MCZ2130976.1 trypsin-like peptidase domain-containing protein [Bacteroidia bacterium]
MKQKLILLLGAAVFGFGGAWLFSITNKTYYNFSDELSSAENKFKSSEVSFQSASKPSDVTDFVQASAVTTPSVVFIKTTAEVRTASPFWFFDYDPFGSIGQVASTGSGVIMSKDGYIATNLHVVKDAVKIEVVLNNKKKVYTAKLIGSDPSTDLALIKIEMDNLPAIKTGNSDNLQIGEWVLAVGNPFNLTSTVTAGIVSAKGRNINIVHNQFPIESFIQTDAAINPGNSGGALVNTKGELIGINTAIMSQTGSYSGYGFAIPVNIVIKTVKDLIEFGEVQRGFTGMDVADIDYETQQKLKISFDDGVYVANVLEDGPAFKAGIRAGDLIVGIQDRIVDAKSSYDEYLSYQRPGDKIKISYKRDGKVKDAVLTLINKQGNTDLIKKTSVRSDELGADFSKVTKLEMQRYGIDYGVKVSEVRSGFVRRMGLSDDFIFVKFNGKECREPNDLIQWLSQANGRIQIEGISADGQRKYYNFYGY